MGFMLIDSQYIAGIIMMEKKDPSGNRQGRGYACHVPHGVFNQSGCQPDGIAGIRRNFVRWCVLLTVTGAFRYDMDTVSSKSRLSPTKVSL